MYKMFHHVINYEHISIAFAIVIGEALQDYEEYNQVPLNAIINVSNRVFPCTHFCSVVQSYYSCNVTLMMIMTKVIDTCW